MNWLVQKISLKEWSSYLMQIWSKPFADNGSVPWSPSPSASHSVLF